MAPDTPISAMIGATSAVLDLAFSMRTLPADLTVQQAAVVSNDVLELTRLARLQAATVA